MRPYLQDELALYQAVLKARNLGRQAPSRSLAKVAVERQLVSTVLLREAHRGVPASKGLAYPAGLHVQSHVAQDLANPSGLIHAARVRVFQMNFVFCGEILLLFANYWHKFLQTLFINLAALFTSSYSMGVPWQLFLCECAGSPMP